MLTETIVSVIYYINHFSIIDILNFYINLLLNISCSIFNLILIFSLHFRHRLLLLHFNHHRWFNLILLILNVLFNYLLVLNLNYLLLLLLKLLLWYLEFLDFVLIIRPFISIIRSLFDGLYTLLAIQSWPYLTFV